MLLSQNNDHASSPRSHSDRSDENLPSLADTSLLGDSGGNEYPWERDEWLDEKFEQWCWESKPSDSSGNYCVFAWNLDV